MDALLQRDPLAMYRLAPAGNIASKGARVSGYRMERRLSDFVVLGAVQGGQGTIRVCGWKIERLGSCLAALCPTEQGARVLDSLCRQVSSLALGLLLDGSWMVVGW